jgi:apolipoprotein N-acyltransferase
MKSTLEAHCLKIALLTPLLWWLAGQGWGGFALGWIALIPLLYAIRDLPPRARFKLGYLIGWISYALINWWILPTIIKSSPVIGAPPVVGAVLGVLAVTIIALGHGLQVAFIALLWETRARSFQKMPWLLPITIALIWGILDWTRSLGPLAHTWGALAYTQWRDTAFLQSVAWAGQHGLSTLCAWFAASIALWMARRDSFTWPVLWRAPLLGFAALHLWGFWVLKVPQPGSQSLRVLVVQTDISALDKNRGFGEAPLQQAIRLTREYFSSAAQPIDLVVWPETVLNYRRFGPQSTPVGLEWTEISNLSRELQTPILSGALGRTASQKGEEIINEALLTLPDGQHISSSKRRLVPFGERAVGGEIWPFLNRLAPDPPIALADDIRVLPLQQSTQTLSTLFIGSVICFESCFPSPATQLKSQGARALFVLTNDEWFSGTEAPWQHAAMAAVRAVENRVPVVQAANGGYAVAVDAQGRFIAIGEYNRPQAIAVNLELK